MLTETLMFVVDIDVNHLIQLKEAQLMYRLSDELAGEMFKEHARKQVEGNISAALSIIKSRTRTAYAIFFSFW